MTLPLPHSPPHPHPALASLVLGDPLSFPQPSLSLLLLLTLLSEVVHMLTQLQSKIQLFSKQFSKNYEDAHIGKFVKGIKR